MDHALSSTRLKDFTGRLCVFPEYGLVLGRARNITRLGNTEYQQMLLASSSSSQNETLFPEILVLSEAGP